MISYQNYIIAYIATPQHPVQSTATNSPKVSSWCSCPWEVRSATTSCCSKNEDKQHKNTTCPMLVAFVLLNTRRTLTASANRSGQSLQMSSTTLLTPKMEKWSTSQGFLCRAQPFYYYNVMWIWQWLMQLLFWEASIKAFLMKRMLLSDNVIRRNVNNNEKLLILKCIIKINK